MHETRIDLFTKARTHDRLAQAVPISESKTVGAMTERQRHALAAMLGEQQAPARGAAAAAAAAA